MSANAEPWARNTEPWARNTEPGVHEWAQVLSPYRAVVRVFLAVVCLFRAIDCPHRAIVLPFQQDLHEGRPVRCPRGENPLKRRASLRPKLALRCLFAGGASRFVDDVFECRTPRSGPRVDLHEFVESSDLPSGDDQSRSDDGECRREHRPEHSVREESREVAPDEDPGKRAHEQRSEQRPAH